jgi:hypothetical protein
MSIMDSLEKLGRQTLPPREQVEHMSTPRLRVWVWFLFVANLIPAVAILLSGHIVLGLALIIPLLLLGGNIVYLRHQLVTPIIDERRKAQTIRR